MGCDIHLVLERRKLGSSEWVGLWASDEIPGGRPKVAQRDYGFFSRLGVRGQREKPAEVIYPRNIPEDVSRLAWVLYMQAPTDHHSASHATTQELADAWLAENKSDATVRSEFAAYDLFGIDDWPENVEHRFVFWFDK